MNMIKKYRSFASIITSFLFILLLSGCGDETSSSSTSNKPTTVNLVIVNQEGDVSQGELLVQDANQKEILNTKLGGSVPYLLEVPAGVEYPVLVTVTPDPSANSKFNDPLKALVPSPLSSKVRVSQKSTSAVEYINTQLGGIYSKENIATATMATMTPDFRPARSYKGGMAKISGK
jgi:hypothetical protein